MAQNSSVRTLGTSSDATALGPLKNQEGIPEKVVGRFALFGDLLGLLPLCCIAWRNQEEMPCLGTPVRGGNKRVDCAPNVWLVQGLLRDWFLSCLIQSTEGTGARIWKLLKTEASSTLELQFHRQTPWGAGDQKRLGRS